jgi:hypothetical protein
MLPSALNPHSNENKNASRNESNIENETKKN